MKIIIAKDYNEMSKIASNIIADVIKENPSSKLGLATGSTPIGTYSELVKKYNNKEISFKDIKAFNLDEYVGLNAENEQSYKYFMNKNLFDKVDIKPENCFIPNGVAENLEEEVKRYDNLLESYGYTDIQILGIGENGHIAFNEPNKVLHSATNIVELKKETIEANSRFFNDINEVPKLALSMGLKGIMASKHILLLASGKNKALAIKEMLSGLISTENPSTLLNLHNNVTVILDKEASELILR